MQNRLDWKYEAPRLHNVLRRERVLRLLKDRSERKLILIHAKAGQGKSTVMADFLKSEKFRSLWYRLDASMADSETFLAEIHRGLDSLDLQGMGEGKGPEATFDGLMNRLHSLGNERIYIVLDDFEFVADSQEIGAVMESAVDHLPENVRLAILSRTKPAMSLARVRLLQNLLEIRDSELAMSDEEGAELISGVFHLNLAPEWTVRINQRADGWVTGIILLLEQLSAQEDDAQVHHLISSFLDGDVHRDMSAFFDEEVFDGIDSRLADALLSIGAFPALTRELAEDLVGPEAEGVLRQASERGLFITPIETGPFRWTLNPLFADYLSNRFDLLPAERQEQALRTAAGRFLSQGMPEQALPCLVRAGLFKEAKERFIEYAEELILGNKHLKIRNLLDVFPEMMRKNDQYLEFYGLVSDNLYHPYATKRKLLKLLPFFEEQGDENRQATIYTVLLQNYFFYQENRETVESLTNMTARFLEKSGSALESRKKRLLEALLPLGEGWGDVGDESVFDAALRAEETSLQLHDSEAYLCSRLVLARKYIGRGDFRSARMLLQKTRDSFGENRYGRPYVSLISFYLGDILFYSGDVHAAIREVQDGLDDSNPDFAFRPYLEVNLLMYNLYLQKFQNAEAMLETLRKREIGENLFLRYFTAYLLEMLLAYRNENRRRAGYYCKRLLEPENSILLATDSPYSLLAVLEVAIWLEEDSLVGSILLRMEDEIDADEHPYAGATFRALEAYYYQKRGLAARAEAPAGLAKTIMKRQGYSNLDICSPVLLHELVVMFGWEPLEASPRIQSLVASHHFRKSSARLEIRTLGTFRIFADGEEIPVSGMISKKRVADLLKLLIIQRESGVRKELIYDLFWPKYSAKNARDNLNTIFYRLRNILGKDKDFFEADSTKIGFREGILDTDVDRFLMAVRAGEELEAREEFGPAVEMYHQAVDTYTGDFLAGDLYSDSIRDERQGLLQKYVNTLFRLARLNLSGGDYLQALECLRKLLEKDPVCEPAVRLLMVASALLGSRNRIPQICEDLGHRLQDAYGLKPDDLTIALKERLLSGEKPTPSMWKNEVIVS